MEEENYEIYFFVSIVNGKGCKLSKLCHRVGENREKRAHSATFGDSLSQPGNSRTELFLTELQTSSFLNSRPVN